jgi:8-oxo-dGTP diphosphatase
MKISVAGIAINKGKFFVARRAGGGSMGGKWEFPGGKLEDGETPVQALIREIQEELEVAIAVGPLLAESEFENKGVKHSLQAYRITFLTDNFILNEHTEWRWADADEIKQLDFTPSDLSLLPALCRAPEAD